jgi:hypothetical protein
MQRVLSSLSISSDLESNPLFNVVIAYEDFETGREAKKVYDFIASNLAAECRCEHQMWKFDVFAIPKLREMAARDASAADIIVISSRSGSLPEAVRNWVDSWLLDKPAGLALVCLCDETDEPGDSADSIDTQEFLKDAARRGNMEFFLHRYSSEKRNSGIGASVSLEEMPYARRGLTPAHGGRAHEQTLMRWGINE